ncbi:MAG: hypothetical protein IPK35_11915 [Saprospiraceae bacterium]|nr:hypothetical protein [Saprospiraceae bacterium]
MVVPVRFQNPIVSGTWYADADGNGWGNPAITTTHCGTSLSGYTQNIPDCNDNDTQVYPGAPENCNDKDYNCDGNINGALPPPSTWYQDSDGDGFGNSAVSIVACAMPSGYVANSSDCNDNNNQIKPGATEVCDNIDNDCDGMIDEGIPTGTSTFTNAGMNTLWSNSANWSPPTVPLPCFNVIIPPGQTVNVNSGAPIQCRSITIASGATLNINGANVTVSGSASAGINNSGVINISPSSSVTISNTVGHGIDNSNVMNISSAGSPVNLSLTNIGQNAIQNNPSATISCNGTTNISTINIDNRALSNNGNFTFRGSWSGLDIQGYVFFNTGTFNNYGNLDLANGSKLPEWIIYNQGTFNHHAASGNTIILPTPSVVQNISDKGIWLNPGSTFNNYSVINIFGNRIAGTGALINHPGSSVSGRP